MRSGYQMVTATNIRFALSLCALYVTTLGFAWHSLQAPVVTQPIARAAEIDTPKVSPPSQTIISGKPSRIVISDHEIDLPVDDGYYAADGTWTLSDTHAQFALISNPANNYTGNTFVYGHGTERVFARLPADPPAIGSTALIYTENGHVFSYSFMHQEDYTPGDTAIFSYDGPPILTVQTCTGASSEFRTFFQYKFEEVLQ